MTEDAERPTGAAVPTGAAAPTDRPRPGRLATVREPRHPDRRTVMRAAGVVGAAVAGGGALAACGGGSGAPTTGSEGAAAPAGTTPAAASGSSAGGASGGGATAVKVADVPVGGGVVNTDLLFVVTQPSSGTFKAFSAVCTHQGCTVSRVENGFIRCPCHGSQFDITTGAPTASSPAKRPLGPKTATVEGDAVVVS